MKIPKLEQDEIIAIVWDDTQTDSKWMDRTELSRLTPAEIRTVGFFHKATRRGIVIKHNLGKDGVADATVIPIGCIKRIRRLRIDEKA